RVYVNQPMVGAGDGHNSVCDSIEAFVAVLLLKEPKSVENFFRFRSKVQSNFYLFARLADLARYNIHDLAVRPGYLPEFLGKSRVELLVQTADEVFRRNSQTWVTRKLRSHGPLGFNMSEGLILQVPLLLVMGVVVFHRPLNIDEMGDIPFNQV